MNDLIEKLTNLCHEDNQGAYKDALSGKLSHKYFTGRKGNPRPSAIDNPTNKSSIIFQLAELGSVLDENTVKNPTATDQNSFSEIDNTRHYILHKAIYSLYRQNIGLSYFGNETVNINTLLKTVLNKDFYTHSIPPYYDPGVGGECYTSILYCPFDIRPETIAILYHRIY